MNDGTNDYYYGTDHLYSPTVLFAFNGTIAERYEYNAYGKVTIYNDNFTQTRTTSLFANPYYFTGRRLDKLDLNSQTSEYDLEIMYYRNRYYDPHTGRFLSRDPLDYVDGMNLYLYVVCQPITKTDPSGLSKVIFPWPPVAPPDPGIFPNPHPPISPPITFPPVDPGGGNGVIQPLPWPEPGDLIDPAFGQQERTESACGYRVYCRKTFVLNGWFRHCDLRNSGVGDIVTDEKGNAVTAENEEWHSVFRDWSPGRMLIDKKGSKPCKCATCADIQSCIVHHSGHNCTIGNNCQTATQDGLAKCCLKAPSWRPSWHSRNDSMRN